MRVIREMQVVAAVTIKVDPALHCRALRRTDGHRQRGRAVSRYRYGGRDSDRGIAGAEGSSFQILGTVPPKVSGVNFVVETLNV